MTYQLVLTGKFKKGLKLARRRGLELALLDSVVEKHSKNVKSLLPVRQQIYVIS